MSELKVKGNDTNSKTHLGIPAARDESVKKKGQEVLENGQDGFARVGKRLEECVGNLKGMGTAISRAVSHYVEKIKKESVAVESTPFEPVPLAVEAGHVTSLSDVTDIKIETTPDIPPSDLVEVPRAGCLVGEAPTTQTPVWTISNLTYGQTGTYFRTAVYNAFKTGLDTKEPDRGHLEVVNVKVPSRGRAFQISARTQDQMIPLPTQVYRDGTPRFVFRVDPSVGQVFWSADAGQFYLKLHQKPSVPTIVHVDAYGDGDSKDSAHLSRFKGSNIPPPSDPKIQQALSPHTRSIFEEAQRFGRRDLYGDSALTPLEQLHYAAARLRSSWTYSFRPKNINNAKREGAGWLGQLHQRDGVMTANCNVSNTEFAVAARAYGYPVRIVTGFHHNDSGDPIKAPGHLWVEFSNGDANEVLDATPGDKLKEFASDLDYALGRKLRAITQYNNDPVAKQRTVLNDAFLKNPTVDTLLALTQFSMGHPVVEASFNHEYDSPLGYTNPKKITHHGELVKGADGKPLFQDDEKGRADSVELVDYPGRVFKICYSMEDIRKVWDHLDTKGHSTLVDDLQNLTFETVSVKGRGLYAFNAKTGILINGGFEDKDDHSGTLRQFRFLPGGRRIRVTVNQDREEGCEETHHGVRLAQQLFGLMKGNPVSDPKDQKALVQILALLLKEPPSINMTSAYPDRRMVYKPSLYGSSGGGLTEDYSTVRTNNSGKLVALTYVLSEAQRLGITPQELQVSNASEMGIKVYCDGVLQPNTAVTPMGCVSVGRPLQSTDYGPVQEDLWGMVMAHIPNMTLSDIETMDPAQKKWFKTFIKGHFKQFNDL